MQSAKYKQQKETSDQFSQIVAPRHRKEKPLQRSSGFSFRHYRSG